VEESDHRLTGHESSGLLELPDPRWLLECSGWKVPYDYADHICSRAERILPVSLLGVVLKPHALMRMAERRITRENVERVLASRVETIEVRFGRKAAFGNVNGRDLLVVYQTKNGDIEVITTFWIDKDGLRKYGFTGI